MNNEKDGKRIFSLGDDFMDFHTDDIIYGYMRNVSTAKPIGNGKYIEYLPYEKMPDIKKFLAQACKRSVHTITRKIDALIESGLVTLDDEVEFTSTGKEKIVKVYHFPVDKENNPFKIIDKKILKYLVDTSNGQCIRVYLYLLNKYLWKQDLDQDYIFTIQEIKEALGYSTTTKTVDETIKNILACFKSQGVIRYKFIREMQSVEGTRLVPVQRMALEYVITDPAKLPKF